jgi:chromosome segregation ATPase
MQILNLSNGGYAIKFPFALKDSFRQAFPSAKWNPDLKQWEVGSRSKTRLEEWVKLVSESGIEEQLNVKEELSLADSEITNLKEHIKSIQLSIKEYENMKSLLITSLKALDEKKEEIKTVSHQAKLDKDATKKLKDELISKLSEIVDLKKIYAASEQMAIWHKGDMNHDTIT